MIEQNVSKRPLKVLVTGGSGFLGKAIVNELSDDQSPIQPAEIRIFDIKKPSVRHDHRIKYIEGDIRNYEAVKEACTGIDLVIHSAAIVDWGTRAVEEVLAVNAGGTENIVKACHDTGVRALVYTSSLDAVYSGKPLVNIDETVAYPGEHETMYCRSKFLGEKTVLAANLNHLKTCVIRPSDIYGEEDPYHMGSLINMAKGGFYVRLGNGKAKCQHTYVCNVAYAHLMAGHALLNGNSRVPGNAYFITDGDGTNFFSFFDRIVEGAGYPIHPKNLWLPRGFAHGLRAISEAIAWLVRPYKTYYPKFSRFAVTYTCTNYTFNSDKARRDFGFEPKYSGEEALKRTVDYYKEMIRD
jgi:sterol-4alpha-carboxylate 3-dehydrogenase (decarboxylating)